MPNRSANSRQSNAQKSSSSANEGGRLKQEMARLMAHGSNVYHQRNAYHPPNGMGNQYRQPICRNNAVGATDGPPYPDPLDLDD
uniref:Uncharacterized protein n=1 Tax=Romanomermis culicivorax TaxID=13658 RepID=A0A915KS24_ROMCU